MTTGGMAYLAIAISGFGSFIIGLFYASIRSGGGGNAR